MIFEYSKMIKKRKGHNVMQKMMKLNDLTVGEFKEKLDNIPDNFSLSFTGLSGFGILVDSEDERILLDEENVIEELFEEIMESREDCLECEEELEHKEPVNKKYKTR